MSVPPPADAPPAPHFPNFDTPVPDDGYHWWYLDALSDDRELGMTVIVFIGSVFSPYYAFRRRRGPTDPRNHCAVNVALYGKRGRRWAMTERGAGRLDRGRDWLRIGASTIEHAGEETVIRIDERAAPLPRRIAGAVRIHAPALTPEAFAIGTGDRHTWWPMAPAARVSVALTAPDLTWEGTGYFDSNWGVEPLEAGFDKWCWGRAPTARGSVIHYDVVRRDGSEAELLLAIDRDGGVTRCPAAAPAELPRTRIWRVARTTRSEAEPARVVETLEDTPFYSRSLIETSLAGERVTAFHESLSLTRFEKPWVQALLPFRMPRLA